MSINGFLTTNLRRMWRQLQSRSISARQGLRLPTWDAYLGSPVCSFDKVVICIDVPATTMRPETPNEHRDVHTRSTPCTTFNNTIHTCRSVPYLQYVELGEIKHDAMNKKFTEGRKHGSANNAAFSGAIRPNVYRLGPLFLTNE